MHLNNALILNAAACNALSEYFSFFFEIAWNKKNKNRNRHRTPFLTLNDNHKNYVLNTFEFHN